MTAHLPVAATRRHPHDPACKSCIHRNDGRAEIDNHAAKRALRRRSPGKISDLFTRSNAASSVPRRSTVRGKRSSRTGLIRRPTCAICSPASPTIPSAASTSCHHGNGRATLRNDWRGLKHAIRLRVEGRHSESARHRSAKCRNSSTRANRTSALGPHGLGLEFSPTDGNFTQTRPFRQARGLTPTC